MELCSPDSAIFTSFLYNMNDEGINYVSVHTWKLTSSCAFHELSYGAGEKKIICRYHLLHTCILLMNVQELDIYIKTLFISIKI